MRAPTQHTTHNTHTNTPENCAHDRDTHPHHKISTYRPLRMSVSAYSRARSFAPSLPPFPPPTLPACLPASLTQNTRTHIPNTHAHTQNRRSRDWLAGRHAMPNRFPRGWCSRCRNAAHLASSIRAGGNPCLLSQSARQSCPPRSGTRALRPVQTQRDKNARERESARERGRERERAPAVARG